MTRVEEESIGASRIGTWIRGKYLLERVLGAGGMAVVYAARHRNAKRFAVKMLRPELSLRTDICKRFLREGYVANTVDHPGAVAVIDDDIAEDGGAFLVMELLEGASVEKLAEAEGGRLGLDSVLVVAHETLDVLAAAHAKGIVHRDIKPANLFVTRSGQVKVLDFGIARLRDADNSATQTGATLGTPAFMAPEQASGRASLVDAQSDLWSVGATMFSLLTGVGVHEGETPLNVIVVAATQQARTLVSTSADVPAQVAGVVDKALAFDKGARWPNAASMRNAIAEVYVALYGVPISVAPLALTAQRSLPPGPLAPSEMGSVPSVGTLPTVPSTPFGGNRTPGATGSAAGFVAAPITGQVTEQPVSGSGARGLANPGRARWIAAVAGTITVAVVVAALFSFRNTPTTPAAPVPKLVPPETAMPAPEPPDPAIAAPPATGAPTASDSPSASASPQPRRPPRLRGGTVPSGTVTPSRDFDRQ